MIIQCEKCQTRFRLDDSRFTTKGVKVRCSKCKHVFTVRKEVSDDDTFQTGMPISDFSFPSTESETTKAVTEESANAPEAVPTPATDTFTSGDIPLENEPAAFNPFESSPFAAEVDKTSESPVQKSPETAPGDISFDFDDISFPNPDSANCQGSAKATDTPESIEAHADAPLPPKEINFDDELATDSATVSEISLKEIKPSPEVVPAPLAETNVKAADDDKPVQPFMMEVASSEQQELPPLSITSRRKQSPLFGVLIAAVALLVISILGFFGYSALSTPKETATTDSGRIDVRGIKSAFVKNSAAGELLVVSGEAFNGYSKPRASLQIMVTVFDQAGQKVTAKNAYGGNPLTTEQLKNLPLDKIEAAMANPFGDSLSNMGVAPGKAIPFVVVLANIPAGAKDFSVQSAGSTVATVK